MKNLVLTALLVTLAVHLAAGQSLQVATCISGLCGDTCLNCIFATLVNNTDTANPIVLCPQNGTFCYIDNYLSNGTSSVQNCTGCSNSSSTSCTGCNEVNSSFVQNYCATDGTCYSINYTNSNNNTNITNTTTTTTVTNITNNTNETSGNNQSSLQVASCAASECGSSCVNCSNSTSINNTNTAEPLVLCPENGTFCFVDYYWPNGSSTLQSCLACANSSNTSCTDCTWVADSFQQDFCAQNGTCWSINYTNNTNVSNATNNALQSLLVQTCSASECGSSCVNCSNSTSINNTNTVEPLVLCPENGTFCFVDYYWPNGSSTLQSCLACANASNTSCTDCTWVTDSFQQDFCAQNGTCWSINFANNTNISNATNNVFQSLLVETCSASECGSSCVNCSNSTSINNTNTAEPLVLCPENGTFCFVDYYGPNGSSTLQSCLACTNSSNTSCSNCTWVTDSFQQDFCAQNGTCWSINFANNTNISNATNNVSQSLLVETCSAIECGSSCFNCSNSTFVNNTNTIEPLVLCPENGTFCFVDYYWPNGSWTLQNCSSCANSSNTSCIGCTWVTDSFQQDFCAQNGTCWSINYTNTTNIANNTSNATQLLLVQTCSASECGSSCVNCSNSTSINNTNTVEPLVLCPENGTFCFVDYYWPNGSWTLQNCSSCANSSNTSCTDCTWVTDSFQQDFCAENGTCWSINFVNNTNVSNATNNASQSLLVQTCSAMECGGSCVNCSNSTFINNTNTIEPLVLCPENGTFCFVDYYWPNGSWTLQNCSSCANSSNTSCTDCTWVTDSFQQDFCAQNGTCWSINFTNTTNVSNNISNATQSLLVETCSAIECGGSCVNCSNSTFINNTNTIEPLVLCPENGTFCFVDYYWPNGSWTLQNCSSCANSSNTSCTDCTWVADSFQQDFCAQNGTCWSINYTNTTNIANNISNVTQSLVVETCPSALCGTSCRGCSNATSLNTTAFDVPLVLCPQNGTFCYVNTYWSNGTWSVQNCSSCENSTNTSCTECIWVADSFVQDYCSADGTCWSINYTNNTNVSNNISNVTQSLWVETCAATVCGTSCRGCANATWINNTNADTPIVLCPLNETFCFIDGYWSNGTWSVQNCSGCANSSNTSCTNCSLVTDSFAEDYCSPAGTCWSITYHSSQITNITVSMNSTNANGTTNVNTTIWSTTCQCPDGSINGTDADGKLCSCPYGDANTTMYPNGTSVTTVKSPLVNGTFIVSSGNYLQVSFGAILVIMAITGTLLL